MDATPQALPDQSDGSSIDSLLRRFKGTLDEAERFEAATCSGATKHGITVLLTDQLFTHLAGIIQFVLPIPQGQKAVRVFLKEQTGVYHSSHALQPLHVLKVTCDLIKDEQT